MTVEDLLHNVKDEIRIETGCPVFAEIVGANSKLKSKFVGYELNEYIILRAPAVSANIRLGMQAGQTIVVKYVTAGIIYAFQSRILSCITVPENLVFIEYPKLVQKQSLRNQQRYFCYYHTILKGETSELTGTVVDISMGGCCCLIPKLGKNKEVDYPEKGTLMEVHIQRPESDKKLVIQGTLSNISQAEMSDRAGFAFENLTDEVQAELQQLIVPLTPI